MPARNNRIDSLAQPRQRQMTPKVETGYNPQRQAFGARQSRNIPKLAQSPATAHAQHVRASDTKWRKGMLSPMKPIRPVYQKVHPKPEEPMKGNLFKGINHPVPSSKKPTNGYGPKMSLVNRGWKKNVFSAIPEADLHHPQYGKGHNMMYDQQLIQQGKDTWSLIEGGKLRERKSRDMRFSKLRLSEAEALMVVTERQKKRSAKITKDIQEKKAMHLYKFEKAPAHLRPAHLRQGKKPQNLMARMQTAGQNMMGRMSMMTPSGASAQENTFPMLAIAVVIVFGIIAYFMVNSEAFSTFLEDSLVEMGMMQSSSWFGSTSWSDRMEYPMAMASAAVVAFFGPMLLALKIVW